MSDTLLQDLLDAGTPAMLVVRVAQELERLKAESAALERRRKSDRDRQHVRRASADVTDDNVTSRDISDVTDTPPSLDKETSPRPPKEINPIPRVTHACALPRKAGGFPAPEGIEPLKWAEFCQQRKKPLSKTSFSRIVNTLREGADVGWPPGELIDRAIGSGWETVFVPKESRNGQRSGTDRLAGNDGLGITSRAARDFLADHGELYQPHPGH